MNGQMTQCGNGLTGNGKIWLVNYATVAKMIKVI
jgi:hypothetical protein